MVLPYLHVGVLISCGRLGYTSSLSFLADVSSLGQHNEQLEGSECLFRLQVSEKDMRQSFACLCFLRRPSTALQIREHRPAEI